MVSKRPDWWTTSCRWREEWGVDVTQRRIGQTHKTEKKVQRSMIRATLMALLGSSLTKALVVHTRINGSAVNFLPCDPTISNCEDIKDNLIGCDLDTCKATNCPDGSIAPILPGNCCPDTSLCPGMSCLAFLGCNLCLLVLCLVSMYRVFEVQSGGSVTFGMEQVVSIVSWAEIKLIKY